jgi:endonuclease G
MSMGLGRRLLTLSALLGCLAWAPGALAQAPGACSQFYQGGQAPNFTPAAATTSGREFCHDDYVVFYSTRLRDPLWSAEHLTKAMAEGADAIDRHDKEFDPQPGLADAEQGAHHDYDHAQFGQTHYDRGHMTPAGDAPSYPSQADTFVVTNIVPQASQLNEHLWANLEASVHRMAELEDEIYVVTGPLFSRHPNLIANRIAIPDDGAVSPTRTCLQLAQVGQGRAGLRP